ncbi:transposable element Tcb2 transposase [Trichonephila clavipes]|uniref:Transposable element Tcb2 transposase n=1 Tax=Trichonephila clavipes TaxID=2585209 RepID=A0A8X6WJU9_TRICX|nr:transposable element Tcb2 transposase [Trichonephila clavipes]
MFGIIISQVNPAVYSDRLLFSFVIKSYSRLNSAFKLCNFISKIMVDFHKRILFSDEAHFCLNGYVNKQNCRIWSEANPQVNFWEHWTRGGTHARKTCSGVTRKTTNREDQRIVWQALVDPTVTRSTIRVDVGVAIVPQTISRQILYPSALSGHSLLQRNIGNCVYSGAKPDECGMPQIGKRFCLVMNTSLFWGQMMTVYGCGGSLVSGTIPLAHTVQRHTAHTAGVIVWGVIAYDNWSTLIVMLGTLTGQHYVDDILRPHVGPFLNDLPGAIFQQDNARPHTARVAQDFLRHFQTFPWLTRSPDLSPVEHVWDQLKRQMLPCPSVQDLELAVQDLWAHLPQDNIRCLMNSMPDRVAACIAAGGATTRY